MTHHHYDDPVLSELAASYRGRRDALASDPVKGIEAFRLTLNNGLEVLIEKRPHRMSRREAAEEAPYISAPEFDELTSAIERELNPRQEPEEDDLRILEDALGHKSYHVNCPELHFEQEIDPDFLDERLAFAALFAQLENRVSTPLNTDQFLTAMYTKHIADALKQGPRLEPVLSNKPKLTDDVSRALFEGMAAQLEQIGRDVAERLLDVRYEIQRTNAETMAEVAGRVSAPFGAEGREKTEIILRRYLPRGFSERVVQVLNRGGWTPPDSSALPQ